MMDKITKEDQIAQVRGFLRACDYFLELNGRFPLRCVQAFLAVALQPGLSASDYARQYGLSASTMSRFLLDIGERNRWMEEGLGLVARANPHKERNAEYYLTDKGEKLLRKVLAQFDRR